jgi:hypothetical protein
LESFPPVALSSSSFATSGRVQQGAWDVPSLSWLSKYEL